jgi:hypothetical protein
MSSLYDATLVFPQVLNFNSKDRVSGTNSSFISLPQILGNHAYDTCCVVGASIPKSFYNMPNGSNTFKLIEDGFPLGVIITIPVGSYTKNNLQTVLTTLLNNASQTSTVYLVSYPTSDVADTFKYTISVISGFTVNQPQIVMFSGNLSPFRQLGFDVGTTYTMNAFSLTSINAINLSYILRAFVKSNMVSDANENILQEFLNYGSFPMLSVVNFQQVNYDMNSRKLNPDIISSWEFSLVDAFGQLIDLNGIPWEITVVFFQRSSTHEVFKQELNITNEERLYRIEKEQKQIEEKISTATPTTTTVEPFSLSDTKPIYQIEPFGITTSFQPKIYQGPV